jgi:hydroxymethylglutaryl-CoA lyase
MDLPRAVTICECFARDGLQNEDTFVATDRKVEFIDAATEAGFRKIEAVSYAHPKYLPQFVDTEDVLRRIRRRAGVAYLGLVPNARGLDRCLEHRERGYGPDAVGTILSASEPHNLANVKRTIAESKAEIETTCRRALKEGLAVIGGIATAFGCPIRGDVPWQSVTDLAAWYADLGVREVLFGDTTGVANPVQVEASFVRIRDRLPELECVAHFHNTRGTALANATAALRAGVTRFDASIGGVGGRPRFTEGNYPQVGGLTGNACTEDLVAMFAEMGINTGIDPAGLLDLGRLAERILGRELHAHVTKTGLVAHRPA